MSQYQEHNPQAAFEDLSPAEQVFDIEAYWAISPNVYNAKRYESSRAPKPYISKAGATVFNELVPQIINGQIEPSAFAPNTDNIPPGSVLAIDREVLTSSPSLYSANSANSSNVLPLGHTNWRFYADSNELIAMTARAADKQKDPVIGPGKLIIPASEPSNGKTWEYRRESWFWIRLPCGNGDALYTFPAVYPEGKITSPHQALLRPTFNDPMKIDLTTHAITKQGYDYYERLKDIQVYAQGSYMLRDYHKQWAASKPWRRAILG